MKKLFTLAFAVVIGVTGVSAQYFSTTQGAQLTYKGTVKGEESEKAIKSTMISVETDADGVITAREEDIQSDPSNPLLEVKTYRNYSYNPTTDITKMVLMTADDFKDLVITMLRQGAEAAGQPISEMDLADLAKSITTKGSLEFDVDPKAAPDTKLAKSTLRLNAGMMTMRANLWDGKILGTETLTVPAGTYDCIKISYSMVISGPNGNEKRNITDWYAKGVGLVKSIETDKKGNINSEDVLVSIK